MPINREKFGSLVKDNRKKLKITQIELANTINTSQSYIASIENGKIDLPDIISIYKLKKVLSLKSSVINIYDKYFENYKNDSFFNSFIESTIPDSVMLIIDEPELFLHPALPHLTNTKAPKLVTSNLPDLLGKLLPNKLPDLLSNNLPSKSGLPLYKSKKILHPKQSIDLNINKNFEFVEDIEFYKSCDYLFMLEDESLNLANINKGDYLFIKENKPISNGDFAIVLCKDELLIREVHEIEKNYLLLPNSTNAYYKPIIEKCKNISIIGKVMGVYSNIST